MIYNRNDIVLLPFPFITTEGIKQKARPALIISDHSILDSHKFFVIWTANFLNRLKSLEK